jgi:hypothetical protein
MWEDSTMRRSAIALIIPLALGLLVAPLATEVQQATKVHRIRRLFGVGSPPSGPTPSFAAFQEGMWDTRISATLNSSTVRHEPGLSTAYENRGAIFSRIAHEFGTHHDA